MAQQGIDNRITLEGIVRNTAVSTAKDGELEEIVNLRLKDGHFIPMNDFEEVSGLEGVHIPYTYIYVHNNAYQHMIGVKQNDGADTFGVYYFADIDDDGHVTLLDTPTNLCDVSVSDEVGVQYSQTGNLLTIIDGTHLKYTYWRKDKYDLIPSDYNGTQMDESLRPEGRVDFKVEQREFAPGQGKMIRAVRSIDKYKSNVFWGRDEEKDQKQRKDDSIAVMMHSRNISREKGEPTGYFLVCTAIKLYDGTFILQSRPLLMSPPNPEEYTLGRDYNCRRFISSWREKHTFESLTEAFIGKHNGYDKLRAEEDDEPTWFEFGTENNIKAKSFSYNPYDNAYKNLMYRTDKHYTLACTQYDNASGYIGACGNIFGLSGKKTGIRIDANGNEEEYEYNAERTFDLYDIDQHFCGTDSIPDLTCIYGNNTYGESHAPAQGYAHFHTYGYFLTTWFDGKPSYSIKSYNWNTYDPAVTQLVTHKPTIGKQIKRYKGVWADIVDTCPTQDDPHYISSVSFPWGVNKGKYIRANHYVNWHHYINKSDEKVLTEEDSIRWFYSSQNNICAGDMLAPEHCASNKQGTYIWCFNMPQVLKYRIKEPLDKSYEDLIESVCVFMSEEIEPTKINEENNEFQVKLKKMHCSVVAQECDEAGAVRIGTGSDFNTLHSTVPLYTFVFQSNNPDFGENYQPERYSKDEIKDKVKTLHNFYLVKEIKFQDYNRQAGSGWLNIDMEKDGVLLNLVQQEALNLDAADRSAYQPKCSLMYNGRLHFANYLQEAFKGFPLNYFCDNTSNEPTFSINNRADVFPNTYSSCIEVELSTNKGTEVVRRYTSGLTEIPRALNPFLSYPDVRAKKMRITIQQATETAPGEYGIRTYFREFDLLNHDFMPIAYYLNPTLKPIEISDGDWDYYNVASEYANGTMKQIETERITDEFIPNGIRVSATDNPIYFPISNTYRIGNAAIVAMATNSIAVGEGQFGTMPLYVFANDGVYGLFVDSSGETAYTNSRPVCRDVCNNWRSVTYTDAGVAFTTDRGLMLLSGSDAIDQSNVLEGKFLKLGDTQLGKLQQVWSAAVSSPMLVELSEQMTNENFLQYIKGAIVGYDSFERELWLSNPNYSYSYVLLMQSNIWVKRSLRCEQYVNNYPHTYMLCDNNLIVLGRETNSGNDTMFLTRPIKVSEQEFKNAYRTILRGFFDVRHQEPSLVIDSREIDMTPKVERISVQELPFLPENIITINKRPSIEFENVYLRDIKDPQNGQNYIHDLPETNSDNTSFVKIMHSQVYALRNIQPTDVGTIRVRQSLDNYERYFVDDNDNNVSTISVEAGYYIVEDETGNVFTFSYSKRIYIEDDTTLTISDLQQILISGNSDWSDISGVNGIVRFIFWEDGQTSSFGATIGKAELIDAANAMDESGEIYCFEYNGKNYRLIPYNDIDKFYYPALIDYPISGRTITTVTNTEKERYSIVLKPIGTPEYIESLNGTQYIECGELLKNAEMGLYDDVCLTTLENDVINISARKNVRIIDNYNFDYGTKVVELYLENPMSIKYGEINLDVLANYNKAKTFANVPFSHIDGKCYDITMQRIELQQGVETTTEKHLQFVSNQNLYNVNNYLDFWNYNGTLTPIPTHDPRQLIKLETNKNILFTDRVGNASVFYLSGYRRVPRLNIEVRNPISTTIFLPYEHIIRLISEYANGVESEILHNDDGKAFTFKLRSASDYLKKAGIYLFGSYDARKWAFLGGNERTGKFRDLGTLVERLDCKYFRILFVGTLESDSSFEYIDISVNARLLSGKLR